MPQISTLFYERSRLVGVFFILLMAFFIPISIVGYNIATPVAVLMVLISGHWTHKWGYLKNNLTLWFILLLLLFFALAMLYSPSPWSDRLYSLRKMSKLAYLPFLLMLNPSLKWRKYIVNTLLLGIMIVAIVALYNKIILHSTDPTSIFGFRIWASFMLALAGTLFLIRCFDIQKRWLYIGLFAVIVYIMFFANTGRTGMLALFIGILFVLIKKLPYKTFFLVFISLLLIVAITVYFKIGNVSQRILHTTTTITAYSKNKKQLNSTHLGLTMNSLKLLKKRPLFGYGTGSYITAYYKEFGIPTDWGSKLGNPENTYMTIATQLGLVGLLLYLYILFRLYRDAGKLKSRESLEYQSLLVVFAIASIADSFLRLSKGGFFFVLLCTLILVATNQQRADAID